jgi:hypothetical protein
MIDAFVNQIGGRLKTAGFGVNRMEPKDNSIQLPDDIVNLFVTLDMVKLIGPFLNEPSRHRNPRPIVRPHIRQANVHCDSPL